MNMESRHYWEENGHSIKYENYNANDGFARTSDGNLKFTALGTGDVGGLPSDDDGEYPNGAYLKKGKQDPMSHRIIEKRRRDRMNNCLADLSRLIPPEYLKKGRGRVEKTEIIEMAIRHLKYLHERANVADHSTDADKYRAGWQECAAEAVRYLADVQGSNESLCVQFATHLQRRCEQLPKGDVAVPKRSIMMNGGGTGGSSSETASSTGSLRNYVKTTVIAARHPESAEGAGYDHFEADHVPCSTGAPVPPPPHDGSYAMDCDINYSARSADGVQTQEMRCRIDGSECRETNGSEGVIAGALRAVRRSEHHTDEYMHSYKFKNSIERRFSRSQDNEAHDMTVRHAHSKAYLNKRRRAAAKHAPPASTSTSTSTSASGSTEEVRENSPQDSGDSSHRHYTPKPMQPLAHDPNHASNHYVPVFALNSIGKYYIPLSVEYACIARQLGPYSMLDARSGHLNTSLHPVTIHVNFQPCLNYHVKKETNEHEWQRR